MKTVIRTSIGGLFLRPYFILTALALASLALCPKIQAVSPAPDGGYPRANTAEGQNALLHLTTGTGNTAVGWFSLESVTTGSFNTGVGAGTLVLNSANANTATGVASLLLNTTGEGNTATGYEALQDNTTGVSNMANGAQALFSNTIGNNNTAIGTGALFSNSTGSHNTAVGQGAGGNVVTATGVICIGADGEDVDHSCFIGNIFGNTSSLGTAVLVNATGRLGTATSSRRFKDDIKLMDQASEALFALKPVTFRYKKEIDPARTSQFGLVAEEVEKVNPDLIVRDKEGKPYSVRYDQVNAMLLNEFLKEHERVEGLKSKADEQAATVADLKSTVAKQEATIAQQQKGFRTAIARQENEIRELTASLREQAAQIQKVSTEVEMSKPAPKVVSSNP